MCACVCYKVKGSSDFFMVRWHRNVSYENNQVSFVSVNSVFRFSQVRSRSSLLPHINRLRMECLLDLNSN